RRDSTNNEPGRLGRPGSRVFVVVGAGRFELPTSWTRTMRATKLRYAPSCRESQDAKQEPKFLQRAAHNDGRRAICQAHARCLSTELLGPTTVRSVGRGATSWVPAK